MPPQSLKISPPLGGVVQSTAFQSQPPYTAYTALNCWPFDKDHRDRISSRPAVISYATGGVTSAGGGDVRLLADLNYATAIETTRYLIASSEGKVYKLSEASGGWTEIVSDLRLSATNPLQSAPFGNKLYIADWEATSTLNTGANGVMGEHQSGGTGGKVRPAFVSDFSASGDNWTESGGTNYEYGKDLGTHPVSALATLLTGKTGARFDGYGYLNRSGMSLPPDGEEATWYAKVGPWDGDSSILGGLGSSEHGGTTLIPDEYALGYNADLDEYYAYVGAGAPALTETVSGKKYCLFKIKLTNSSGTITAVMTITDLADDSVLLSHTATRSHTSSTLFSQIRCDGVGAGKKIFIDEVGYNAETVPEPGSLVGAVGSITDPTVDSEGGYIHPAWDLDASEDYLLVISGSATEAGASTANDAVYEVLTSNERDLYLKGSSPIEFAANSRWHLVKTSEGPRDCFVVPSNYGWSDSLSRDHMLRVTGTGTTAGLWEITGVEWDKLTIQMSKEQADPPPATGAGGRDLMWCLPRTAKVLDLEASTLSRWVPTEIEGENKSKGEVPHGSKMIVTWQDRMVMGNDQVSPHVWYMSRNGVPEDWAYGAEDLGSPVAGTTFQGGMIGEPLTALIAHNKSCLLFGAEDSLWMLRGEPMQGGYIERISDDIGVVGPWSHAKSDQDVTFFLSPQGLYMMPGGCGEMPRAVSRGPLPSATLQHWSFENAHVGFDATMGGILMVDASRTSTISAVWYDLRHKGFWPLDFGSTYHPKRLMHWYPAGGHKKGTLLQGGDTGRCRRYDQVHYSDENTTVYSATVTIGPIAITPSSSFSAMVQEIRGVVDSWLAGAVTPLLQVAPTAQGAVAVSPAPHSVELSGWSTTGNKVSNPRASGHAVALKLTTSAGHANWAFEGADMTILPLGRAR